VSQRCRNICSTSQPTGPRAFANGLREIAKVVAGILIPKRWQLEAGSTSTPAVSFAQIAAIPWSVPQNGNAYEEGLNDGWTPIRAYWEDPSPANRDALRAFLKPETTVWQHTHGVPDNARVSPDVY
jgi:hypothetical protein